ncbi:serine hydrolase [Kiritimatiellota bacterium B12222]|nr:serine hydrolase [Kiritimatiellota bacterium B12222]
MSTFEGLKHEITRGIQAGEHFGAQVAISVKGERLLEEAMGMNEAFQPLQQDMLMLWLSACKPVAAVACGILMDRGLLDLERPVAEWIPEFASRKKDKITPRHLLTHTAGIRGATLGWRPKPWEDIIGMICHSKPEPHWAPGELAGYHVDSAWYMLGELIRVIDGRPYEHFVREEIFLPLGMESCWVGIDDDLYEDWEDRVAMVYDTHFGVPVVLEELCSRESVTCCRPGGNGRGPAREFILFYEALQRMVKGESGILKPETARTLVDRHRVGMMDKTFRRTIDWGLGFMRQSDFYAPGDTPYQFGNYASREAFGHCGNQSTASFCDPSFDLCVSLLFNGLPGEDTHQARMRAALSAIYEDLGFTSECSTTATES